MAGEVGGLQLPPGTRLPVLIVSLSDWIPACSLDPAPVLKRSGFKTVCVTNLLFKMFAFARVASGISHPLSTPRFGVWVDLNGCEVRDPADNVNLECIKARRRVPGFLLPPPKEICHAFDQMVSSHHQYYLCLLPSSP